MSGFTKSEINKKYPDLQAFDYLQKPFEPQKLLEQVKNTLLSENHANQVVTSIIKTYNYDLALEASESSTIKAKRWLKNILSYIETLQYNLEKKLNDSTEELDRIAIHNILNYSNFFGLFDLKEMILQLINEEELQSDNQPKLLYEKIINETSQITLFYKEVFKTLT